MGRTGHKTTYSSIKTGVGDFRAMSQIFVDARNDPTRRAPTYKCYCLAPATRMMPAQLSLADGCEQCIGI